MPHVCTPEALTELAGALTGPNGERRPILGFMKRCSSSGMTRWMNYYVAEPDGTLRWLDPLLSKVTGAKLRLDAIEHRGCGYDAIHEMASDVGVILSDGASRAAWPHQRL